MNEENDIIPVGSDAPYAPQQQVEGGFKPSLSQTEYIDKLGKMGYKPRQITSIMMDGGFDGSSVQKELLANYEREREAFLEQQRQQRAQMQQMEEERRQREEFFNAEKKKDEPFERGDGLSMYTEDEAGQPVSIARPEFADEYERLAKPAIEYYDPEDALSPTAMPDQMIAALDAGNYELVDSLFQSNQNDARSFDVFEATKANERLRAAVAKGDYESARATIELLNSKGYEIPDLGDEIDQRDVEYVNNIVSKQIQKDKRELIEERNRLNEAFGLPSSFNPESDVDFMYLLDESMDRNLAMMKNSPLYRYQQKVDEAVRGSASADMYKSLYSGDVVVGGEEYRLADVPVLGWAWRSAANLFAEKYAGVGVGIVSGAAGVVSSGLDLIGMDDAALKLSAYADMAQMLDARAKAVAYAEAARMPLEDLENGFLGSWEKYLNDDISTMDFFESMSFYTSGFIGMNKGYGKILGGPALRLQKAKAIQKGIPAGEGLLTKGAASAARRADQLVKSATRAERARMIGTLGVSGYGNFWNSQHVMDPSKSWAEKSTMATLIGAAEVYLGRFFIGFDKAVAGGRTRVYRQVIDKLKKESAERLEQMTKRRSLARSMAYGSKNAMGEFAEEFSVELIQQALPILDDMLMGREPGEMNWYNVLDAGIAGLVGAAPGSAMSGYASFQAHNSFIKRRRQLVKQMEEIENDLSIERDPDNRKRLEAAQIQISAELMAIDDSSMKAFDNMSEGQRRRLLKIHRDMAYTEAKLMDPNTTKEEKEQLKKRYENLYRAKVAIEGASEGPDVAENDTPVTTTDAEGNETEMKSESIKMLERNNIKLSEQSSEPAPEGQAQEAEQLSLFDETQEGRPIDEGSAKTTGKIIEEQDFRDKVSGEKSEAKTEAPKAEQAARPTTDDSDFADLDLGKGDLIDITDETQVGESGRMSVAAAIQANRLNSAYGEALGKAGYKVRAHKTRASYEASGGLKGGFGHVAHGEKIIHFPPDVNAREVQEEFAHAALRHVIGNDAFARKQIYGVLVEMAEKNEAVRNILEETKNNPVYQEQGQAAIEEESIVEVLLSYAENQSLFEANDERFFVRLKNAINDALDRFLGRQPGDQRDPQIKNREELIKFAQNFARATRGEQDVTTEGPSMQKRETESQAEYEARLERMATEMLGEEETEQQKFEDEMGGLEDVRFAYGKRKTEFNYLKDTEVFYTEDAYVEIGDPGPTFERSVQKKIKVNDYFHFRNWFNHMTANGRRPGRITQMYFIKDGKKYTIKPPKPKTDRDGNVVRMEGALNGKFANYDRAIKRQQEQATKVRAIHNEVVEFSSDVRKEMMRAGVPGSNAHFFMPGLIDADAMQSMDEEQKEMAIARALIDFGRKPIEHQRELLDVAKKNFEALKESGLTPGEIEAMKPSDIYNMSGLTPHHMAKDGDATNDGGIRYSAGKREKIRTVQATDGLLTKAQNRGARIIDSLREFAGARGINFGYDRSGEQIGTGIVMQLTQRVDNDGISEIIASSHRNKDMANIVAGKFRREAILDAQSKNPKGYVLFTFSVLDLGSMAGNPAIFQDVVRQALGFEKGRKIQVTDQNFEQVKDALNEMIDAKGKGKRRNIKDLMSALEPGAARRIYNAYQRSEAFQVETMQEAQALVDILMDAKPGNFDQNFENRNNFARRIIAKNLNQNADQFLKDNYVEKQFGKVEGGTIVAAIKVPYRIEGDVSKNQLKRMSLDNKKRLVLGLDVVGLSGNGAFSYGLSITKLEGETQEEYDSRVEQMGFLREQMGIADAYPEAKGYDKKQERFFAKFMSKEEFEASDEANKFDKYEDYLEAQESFYSAKGVTGQVVGEETVTHSDREDTIRRSAGKRKHKAWDAPNHTGFQRWKNLWIRRLQDKYVDIFNLQESIEKQFGPLSKDKDFKMAEELMYGKAAEDLAKLDKKVEEITKMMKGSGVDVTALSQYLYALHAKERNAIIEQRTNGKIKDGSGMSNAEADAIINSSNKAQLDPIVAKVREIQQDTRDTMVKYGLETKDTVDAFESMFSNYVPLAGVAVDEDLGSPYPTGGAGMNVFGSTTKRAQGRKSQAENILAQIVAQNAGIHIKARTNEALTSLYNLIQDTPNPKVWRVLDASQVQNPNDARVVAVRINGEQKFIFFKDPSYAESLKGMNLPQTNAFIRALRVPAQWLRRSFTTLNPEFMISNFSRDIQSAIFNAAAEADIEGGMLNSKGTIKRMMKLVPQTLKTLVKNSVQRGGDPAIEKYFQEFKEDGGKTGWAYARSLDQIASDLEAAADGKTRTQEILGKAKNFAETIEGVNDAFENSIRLAAYIAARENGVSREKAAQLAKNITVNFNKQGEWGPALNAVYLFFNASIQGTARLGRSLLTLKPQTRVDGTRRKGVERVNAAQWMAAGLTTFSAMLAQLGYAMSDDDEDGTPYWDKIPDYVKERNLIIMRPNGKDYFKIPMPYGFNVFANMGTAMVESAHGGKEADEAMMFLFNSFMASFSPVSFGQSKDLMTSVGKGAVPTVLKPWVEVMLNETYFGAPVTGENLPFGVQRPESELSFRSPEAVKDFFKWMNEATGGSEYKSGGLDFNPDKLWYMFEYYIGSAGQFVNRSVAVPKKIISKFSSGEDIKIDANEIPLARILYGEPSKYYDFELFNENKQELKSYVKEIKESGQYDPERHKGITRGMDNYLNKVDKMLRQLRAAKREASKLPYAQRTARIQELREKERKIIMEFNKRYEQARK